MASMTGRRRPSLMFGMHSMIAIGPCIIPPSFMADPLRDQETSSRIEELLLAGLDHYFSGHHELAINVWTRVLFLDRSHARARARHRLGCRRARDARVELRHVPLESGVAGIDGPASLRAGPAARAFRVGRVSRARERMVQGRPPPRCADRARRDTARRSA